jgi:hypothetical protein
MKQPKIKHECKLPITIHVMQRNYYFSVKRAKWLIKDMQKQINMLKSAGVKNES